MAKKEKKEKTEKISGASPIIQSTTTMANIAIINNIFINNAEKTNFNIILNTKITIPKKIIQNKPSANAVSFVSYDTLLPQSQLFTVFFIKKLVYLFSPMSLRSFI